MCGLLILALRPIRIESPGFFAAGCIAVAVACVAFVERSKEHASQKELPKQNADSTFSEALSCMAFVVSIVYFTAGAVSQVGTTGIAPAWDAWEYWVLQAEVMAHSGTYEGPDYALTGKHGGLLPIVVAVILQLLQEVKAELTLYFWPLCYAITALLIVLISRQMFGSTFGALIAGVTFLSTPIINIHASLPGYADLVFAMLLAALIYIRALLASHFTIIGLYLFLVLSGALLNLKQIGILVIGSMMFAEALCRLLKSPSRQRLRVVCAGMILVFLATLIIKIPLNLEAVPTFFARYFPNQNFLSESAILGFGRSEDIGVFIRKSLSDPSQGILLFGFFLLTAMHPFDAKEEESLQLLLIVWGVTLLLLISLYFAFFGYEAALGSRSHNRVIINISPILAVSFGWLVTDLLSSKKS